MVKDSCRLHGPLDNTCLNFEKGHYDCHAVKREGKAKGHLIAIARIGYKKESKPNATCTQTERKEEDHILKS